MRPPIRCRTSCPRVRSPAPMKTVIIVPTYNEAENVPILVTGRPLPPQRHSGPQPDPPPATPAAPSPAGRAPRMYPPARPDRPPPQPASARSPPRIGPPAAARTARRGCIPNVPPCAAHARPFAGLPLYPSVSSSITWSKNSSPIGSVRRAHLPSGAITPLGAEHGRCVGAQLSTVTIQTRPAAARIWRFDSW